MLKRELNKKTVLAAIAVTLLCTVLGMAGYNSYRQKQLVNEVVARRELTISREMGITAEMDGGDNATPEERKAARTSALELKEWNGKSKVEDPTPAPSPSAP